MEFEAPANFGEHQLSYRSGDIVDPAHRGGGAAQPRAAGLRARDPDRRHAALARRTSGLEIVAVIEAAEASLRRNGEPVALEPMLERAAA